MQVQVQGLAQVGFHLQVRKAGLALISMKELDTLMNDMVDVMNRITSKDYSVILQMTLDGVMTSTNA